MTHAESDKMYINIFCRADTKQPFRRAFNHISQLIYFGRLIDDPHMLECRLKMFATSYKMNSIIFHSELPFHVYNKRLNRGYKTRIRYIPTKRIFPVKELLPL